MAQPNFGLLNTNLPAEIAGSVQRGQDEALRSQMAQQQLASNQQQFRTAGLQQESAQMQLEQAKRERDSLTKMQQAFIANGKSPDMRSNFQEMVQSGIPHFMDIGIKGMQALDRQDRVAKILGGGMPTEAPAAAPSVMRQPAAPMPAQNALGTGMYGMEPTAPVNALAARPSGAYAPVMPRNALATGATNDIENTYRKIDQLHAAGEHELAKSLEQRVKDKLPPTAVQEYKFAQTPEGGNFKGTFEAFKVLHTPRTTTNVNVPVSVSTEKKYGEAFGTKIADVDIGKMTTAEKAPQMAENANRIINLVKQGNVFTGPAADVKLNIARVLNVAGASNDEKIANTESLIAGTGQSTLDAIKGAGLGTGQGFTDKDLRFLQGIAGGTIGLTAKTLTDLAELQHRVAVRSAEAWNKRSSEMPKEVIQGTGLNTTPIKVPPLSSGAAKAAARPAGVGANWTFERDNAGNTAWVSPDRKSFKEAQ
jgi:hypothetical protein